MPLIYKEVRLNVGYRLDLFVGHKVVVEIKVAEAFTDVHLAQMIIYLRSSNCTVGYY
jgi:GxxExxY protein